jgi:predicted nuclease with TOPRIM domain
MDIDFGKISEQIRENREKFKGLTEEQALKLELKQKDEFIASQYDSMRDYAEVQVTRLKDRITKLEEDLVKQQPRIFVSSKERSKNANSDEG